MSYDYILFFLVIHFSRKLKKRFHLKIRICYFSFNYFENFFLNIKNIPLQNRTYTSTKKRTYKSMLGDKSEVRKFLLQHKDRGI